MCQRRSRCARESAHARRCTGLSRTRQGPTDRYGAHAPLACELDVIGFVLASRTALDDGAYVALFRAPNGPIAGHGARAYPEDAVCARTAPERLTNETSSISAASAVHCAGQQGRVPQHIVDLPTGVAAPWLRLSQRRTADTPPGAVLASSADRDFPLDWRPRRRPTTRNADVCSARHRAGGVPLPPEGRWDETPAQRRPVRIQQRDASDRPAQGAARSRVPRAMAILRSHMH